jgi:predicted nucleotidyltransferase component of viral defense system
MFDRNNPYFKQAELLVRILPFIAEKECFAIKGGTAINLFIRDMPRLSVDIDLVYLPIKERAASLKTIDLELKAISEKVLNRIKGLESELRPLEGTGKMMKIMLALETAKIKIEASPIIRGVVFPSERKEVSEKVKELLGYAEANIVSLPDLYAGKICAALDRQHPRDLFDILYLLKNEGVTADIFKAFKVYLISHNRPMSELLNPCLKDLARTYNTDFSGMTVDPIPLDELYDVRSQLIAKIRSLLTDIDKEFFLSFKSGNPDWKLLGIEVAEKLPAVQWKLINIRKMPDKKRAQALLELKNALEI